MTSVSHFGFLIILGFFCREAVGLSVFSDDETDLIRELQTMCSSKSEPDISKVLSLMKTQQTTVSGMCCGKPTWNHLYSGATTASKRTLIPYIFHN